MPASIGSTTRSANPGRSSRPPAGRMPGESCSSLQRSKAPIVAEAVRRIDELFTIECLINGKPAEERLAVREERAKPLVSELEAWLRVQYERVSRKSEVGKAIAY